jgi:hypothetical protein
MPIVLRAWRAAGFVRKERFDMNISTTIAASVLAATFLVGTAHAGPVHNTPVCDLNGVVVTSQQAANAGAFRCNFSGNDVQGDNALNELNGGFLDGLVDDWVFVGKSDDNGSGVTAQNNLTSGTWSLNPAVTGVFAITLKAGNGFSAYAFNVDFLVDGGTFDTALAQLGNQNPAALSHLSLFVFEGDVPQPSQVPLPAAGWMLLAGVGGIVAMKRRKKSDA